MIAVLSGFCHCAWAVTYTMNDSFVVSGSQIGYQDAVAGGIFGTQVVGDGLTNGSPNQGLIWTDEGSNAINLTPTKLSGFNGSDADGTDGTNQVGDGLGTAAGGTGGAHAMLWSSTAASAVDLNPTNLTGFTYSIAENVAGNQEVGWGSGTGTSGNNHALLWTGTANSAVDLNPTDFFGLTFVVSEARNTNSSQQVGYASTMTSGGNHAMVWSGTAGSAVDLEPAGFLSSQANAISGTQIVGSASTLLNGSYPDAILWTSETAASAVNLNPPSQGPIEYWSAATCTNGAQQVGFVQEYTGTGFLPVHAVAWSGTTASMVDLNNLLTYGAQSSGSYAEKIDAYGNISGYTAGGDAALWLAGDTYNISSGTGVWNISSNWLSGIPALGNDVMLIQSDNTSRTITYASTNAPNLGNITIDATGAGSITLSQSQNTLNSGNEYIGFIGVGQYTQSGGTNHITSALTLGAKTGSSGNYTLSGSGVLTAGTIVINAGTFTQSGGTCTAGSLANNAAFTQTAGSITLGPITGTGSLSIGGTATIRSIVQNSLSVSGTLSLVPAGTTSTVNSLTISASGKLDLTLNVLTVNYSSVDPVGTIKSLLATGYNNGKWNGTTGIVSSEAAVNTQNSTTVGYLDTGSQIEIKYTWVGDTDLNGVVNSADLSAMLPTGTTWQTGDFNYDGKVNADDYSLFMLGDVYGSATNISATLPEPAAGLLIPALALGGLPRRVRRE